MRSEPRVLRHVMAHELGHLLLGSNAHAEIGIMRPRWFGQQLRAVERGALFFSPEQALLMRNGLGAV
jgi:Zn-dependent peptidase ImmA (M78 family)